MTDMACYLAGTLIPKPSRFVRTDQINKTTITTLGNARYTDYVNLTRSWEIGWDNMLYADYQTIRTIYFNQMALGYPYFTFPAYSVYAMVEMDITQAQLQLNGVLIPSFTMTLKEKLGIS